MQVRTRVGACVCVCTCRCVLRGAGPCPAHHPEGPQPWSPQKGQCLEGWAGFWRPFLSLMCSGRRGAQAEDCRASFRPPARQQPVPDAGARCRAGQLAPPAHPLGVEVQQRAGSSGAGQAVPQEADKRGSEGLRVTLGRSCASSVLGGLPGEGSLGARPEERERHILGREQVVLGRAPGVQQCAGWQRVTRCQWG